MFKKGDRVIDLDGDEGVIIDIKHSYPDQVKYFTLNYGRTNIKTAARCTLIDSELTLVDV